MKTIIYTFLLFWCSQAVAEKASITGKLMDTRGINQIEAYLPVGPYANIYLPTMVDVKEKKIQLNVDITSPVFIRLKVGRDPVYLLVSPLDNIVFEIYNTNDKYKFIRFHGSNAAVQNWFNIYNYNPMANYGQHDDLIQFDASDNVDVVMKRIADFLTRERAPLDSLKNNELVSAAAYELCRTEVEDIHWLDLYKKAYSMQREKKSPNWQKYLDLTKAIGMQADIKNIRHAKTCFGGMFLDAFYESQKNAIAATDLRYNLGPYNGYLTAPADVKCRQIGTIIIFQGITQSNEFDINKAAATYLEEYPDSPYREVIIKKKWINFDNSNMLVKVNSQVVIDTVSMNNSLKDILDKFKGKRVFIDLWASWCIPCRAEFPHYKKIKEQFRKANISPIFVSLDIPAADKKWQQLIRSNDIEGYHIRASVQLINNIKQLVYHNKAVSVPRYLFFNEDGKVITYDAPRPSEPALLSLLSK